MVLGFYALILLDAGTLCLLTLWLFALGACIGSFLNVVVYRMPRRKSLVYPGSRCPACGKPIRWYDNVPIVGWMRLRGRCRDCKARISPRYPIVEALVGIMFVLVAWRDMFNVVGYPLPPRLGVVSYALGGQAPTNWSTGLVHGLVPWAYHVLVLTVLAAAALIESDRLRPSLRLYFAGLVIGLVVPSLHFGGGYYSYGSNDIEILDNFLAWGEGLVSGLLLAAAMLPALARGPARAGSFVAAPLAMAMIGGALDWQAVVLAAALGLGLYLVGSLVALKLAPLRRFGLQTAFALATLWIVMMPASAAAFAKLCRLADGIWWQLAFGGALFVVSILVAAVRIRLPVEPVVRPVAHG